VFTFTGVQFTHHKWKREKPLVYLLSSPDARRPPRGEIQWLQKKVFVER
jgi:hypothetical protein